MMKSQSYYRLEGNDCNIRETDRPLVVNCAGLYSTEDAFTTVNSQGRHDFYLMYLAQGTLPIGENEEAFLLPAGGMYLFPPERSYRYGKQTAEPLCYYWAHFTGRQADELLEAYGLSPGIVYLPEGQEEVAADFRDLFRCFYGRGLLFEGEAAGIFAALLARLARRAAHQSGAPGFWRIRGSLDYLYRHYAQPIRLEQLADIEHLSPSRYSAVFRACMGVSPQGFLIGLRMQNAADLLRRTDLSVAQVAQAVGYEDALYFSGLFHRRMGLPPSRYREQFAIR